MININYKWDNNLAIVSAKEIYNYELNKSNKKYIGLIFIAMLQFGVVGALKHDVYGFLVVSTLGLVYWYGLRWPLRKYFINKTFEKSPLSNKTISLVAKDDGIYLDNQLQISYNNINDIVELENGIVIYHQAGTSYFPNSSFDSKKDKEKFIKLLLSHLS
jgi:hypothetical protein